MKRFCLIVFLFAGVISLQAQELNAVVKVNSTGVGGTNRQMFSSLEEALRTFINGRKWTNATVRADERVNCTVMLVINEMPSSNTFRGELYVQSHRPVKNSTYASPMLNIRDTEMEFDYTEHQPLQFDPNFLQGNLTTTIAYYMYLVLGLDLDSRTLLGGTSCFRDMELIAANAQSYGWRGWERRNNRNRPAIASAFNDGALEDYRKMWYNYHNNGLDNGAALQFISTLQGKRSTPVLIRLFGDAKLDEVIALLANAGAQEKQQAHDILIKLYPTRSTELGRLR